MTTSYYISWMVRATNQSRRWYTSPYVDTEAQSRALFEAKMARPNVREAYLYKRDHYDASELTPTYAAKHPEGSNAFTQLAAYCRV